MRPHLLAVIVAVQSAGCGASQEPVSTAKACTEITAGNSTVVIKDVPASVLARVGRWKLGKMGAELGSSEVIERSDVREAVKVESEGKEVVVSASLSLVGRQRDWGKTGYGCGPGVVHLSDLTVGEEHFLQDTGITVLRALTETGGW